MLNAQAIDQALGDFLNRAARDGEGNASLLRPFFESDTWQAFVADFLGQFAESEELLTDPQSALSLFGAQCFLAGIFTQPVPQTLYSKE